MKNLPWSALAMCFDCEGTISLGRHNKTENGKPLSVQLDLTIVNTDERLMKWLMSNFGGRYYHRPTRDIRHKSCFRWRITGKSNKEKVLLGILPYLIIKEEQAKVALEFIRMPVHHRDWEARRVLMEACQKLNAKGPAPTTNTLDDLDGYATDCGSKIESELHGDMQRAPGVIQGGDEIPGLITCPPKQIGFE